MKTTLQCSISSCENYSQYSTAPCENYSIVETYSNLRVTLVVLCHMFKDCEVHWVFERPSFLAVDEDLWVLMYPPQQR